MFLLALSWQNVFPGVAVGSKAVVQMSKQNSPFLFFRV